VGKISLDRVALAAPITLFRASIRRREQAAEMADHVRARHLLRKNQQQGKHSDQSGTRTQVPHGVVLPQFTRWLRIRQAQQAMPIAHNRVVWRSSSCKPTGKRLLNPLKSCM